MDAELYSNLVSQVTIGKILPGSIYIHKDGLTAIPPQLQQFVKAVAKAVSYPDSEWNLIKLHKNEFRVSLLHYPEFYEESYPPLRQSLNVDLSKLSHKITNYENSDNPPILHRKETMILPDNKYYEEFSAITQEGENAGLYSNSRLIGFQRSWKKIISNHGYELVDGRLFRSASFTENVTKSKVDRHKTAITRHELSAPMKSLAKHGYLDGAYSIFDYGCGKGDDLRELEAHGLDAIGWDPNFLPDSDRITSDIVNLGFVLNVIEDQDERLEALLNAWELTDKLLVVSVMLANENFIARFKPFKDGVITSRNTFQKYYAQSEIKFYIDQHLQEEAIAVAPGIFYIFKDRLKEQDYLQKRYKRKTTWQQQTSPISASSKDKAKLIVYQNSELCEKFWDSSIQLGRIPANDEFESSEQIKSLFGSHKKAHKLLSDIYEQQDYERARENKKEDLLLYLAMEMFTKRKPYSKQPDSFKRDIKAFFSDYTAAKELATEILFSISDQELINELCETAHHDLPASILNQEHSLILHKQYIDELPLTLRTYVGAGLQLYGDLGEETDLIKIHITSGKLTLTSYDDFSKSVPMLIERVKIKMHEQEIDFFDYIDKNRQPPLLNKHLLLSEEDTTYKKQLSFDKRLAKKLGIPSSEEVNMHSSELNQLFFKNNIYIQGFTIRTVA